MVSINIVLAVKADNPAGRAIFARHFGKKVVLFEQCAYRVQSYAILTNNSESDKIIMRHIAEIKQRRSC